MVDLKLLRAGSVGQLWGRLVDRPEVDEYQWALPAGAPRDQGRRTPPFCLARYLEEVRPDSQRRHQNEHVSLHLQWGSAGHPDLRKMGSWLYQSTLHNMKFVSR